jgi:hypothetical protein
MPVAPLTISTITPRSRSVGMLATLAPTRLPFSSLNADHLTGCCPTVIAAPARLPRTTSMLTGETTCVLRSRVGLTDA